MIQDADLRRLFLIPTDCAAPRGAANMILNVAETTANEMLNAVAARLVNANLELLDGDGELLCELGLFDPGPAVDKEIAFRVEDGIAVRSGTARFGRAIAADKTEIFSCDVGGSDSNCVIKLAPTAEVSRNEVVKLSQFRLRCP